MESDVNMVGNISLNTVNICWQWKAWNVTVTCFLIFSCKMHTRGCHPTRSCYYPLLPSLWKFLIWLSVWIFLCWGLWIKWLQFNKMHFYHRVVKQTINLWTWVEFTLRNIFRCCLNLLKLFTLSFDMSVNIFAVQLFDVKSWLNHKKKHITIVLFAL